MRYIIGDTETTGLGPKRKACEVALLEIDADLNIVGEAESFINPERLIEASAIEIHGISNEAVADAPTLPQWIESAFGGPLDGDICLIGYRVGFDKPLLEPVGNIVKTFDVLTMAQTMVSGVTDHKLQTMKEHFGLPGGPAHRAMGDVLTTYQLLSLLVEKSRRSLVAHCATEFQMVHRMPWGKHTGCLLVDLPPSYRVWLLGLADLDPNLRKSVELVRKTDLMGNL